MAMTGEEYLNDIIIKRFKTRQSFNKLVDQFQHEVTLKGLDNKMLAEITTEYEQMFDKKRKKIKEYDNIIIKLRNDIDLKNKRFDELKDEDLEKEETNYYYHPIEEQDNFSDKSTAITNLLNSTNKLKAILNKASKTDEEKLAWGLAGGVDFTNNMCDLFTKTDYGKNNSSIIDACKSFNDVKTKMFDSTLDSNKEIKKLMNASSIAFDKP